LGRYERESFISFTGSEPVVITTTAKFICGACKHLIHIHSH